MTEPERYGPSDFSWPPSSSFQAPQQQQQHPRTSSSDPSMWSWDEPPPSWNDVVSPGWCPGEEAGSSFHPDHGGYEQSHPHRQSGGRERYQGGRMNFRPYRRRGRKKNKRKPTPCCDTCGRVFKNQYKYDKHVSQHVECPEPDCNFVANEKFVSMHWKNKHAPGPKKFKLDTPEEICKWREERRKNYPTAHNVEKKAMEQTGGVCETALDVDP